MSKSLACLVSSICMLVLTAPAFAEVEADTFTVSPFVGGYTFDGVQRQKSRQEFGIRGGYSFTDHFALEAVFGYVETKSSSGGGHIHQFNYRLDALYHFLPENRLVPYVAAGFGGLTALYPDDPDKTRGVFNYGAGLKYFLTDALALRGDVRNLVFTDRQTLYNYEYTAGLDFVFGGARPASVPVPVPPPAPAPAPAPAPTANLSVNPATVVKGQMTTLSWTSQHATNCTLRPELGPIQTEGSKTVTPAETTSYTLTCSGAGGEATSTATVHVTQPPAPVPPVAPPPAPATPSAAPAQEKSTIHLLVEFDFDKSDTKPRYQAELAKVAGFLQKYPSVTGVIEGHTDSVGSARYNMKLSLRRAANVRKYLIHKYGIDPSRLIVKGYGKTRPKSSNATAQGRQKNRRAEGMFVSIK